MQLLGFALMGIGFVAMLITGLVLIVRAFQASPLWGLAYLFVPFAALAFVVLHWDKAGKPFLGQLLGLGLLVGGVFAAAPEGVDWSHPESWEEATARPDEAAPAEPPDGAEAEAEAGAEGAPEGEPRGGPIYVYRDDAGNVFMVQDLDLVPERYRDDMEVRR